MSSETNSAIEPPRLPAPVQALINELSTQRDLMGQRAATFSMRLAVAEEMNAGLRAEIVTLRSRLDALQEERAWPEKDVNNAAADTRPAQG